MSIFSGLELFGFKNIDREIYTISEDKKGIGILEETKQKNKKKTLKEEDILFLKTYRCPVCDEKFRTLTVRAGKIRSAGQDDDLRPLFKEMDPVKYDAIVCPHCGYGALARYFDSVMPVQGKKLRAEVKENFKGILVSEDKFSYDEAIMRYKIVLMCDVVGGVKNSRKAYTCLKLAWVIRGKLEKEEMELTAEEIERLHAEEMECIQNAYEGYMIAFSTENFPMGGMDEITVTYLTAELAFKLDKYRESLTLLSRILGNSAAPSRIKEKALDLKEKIRSQVQSEK